MQLYLKKIIPRIKQFSQSLDRKEIFVDEPWVMIDENLNQQKYIFKRNGELLMSLNGTVKMGKWEYLSGAKSLLIDRVDDKILLNQNFVDPVVMILNMDGVTDGNIMLANERLLPDLDVLKYCKGLFYKLHEITEAKMQSGEILEIHNGIGYGQNQVTINGESVPDQEIVIANSLITYIIKDGRVSKILITRKFNTDKGEIAIEHDRNWSYNKGDRVFQNGIAAPDGKYKINVFKSIKVLNGRII